MNLKARLEKFGHLLSPTQHYVLNAYIEFQNDYLTVERFAEDKQLSLVFANALINEGREIQNSLFDMNA